MAKLAEAVRDHELHLFSSIESVDNRVEDLLPPGGDHPWASITSAPRGPDRFEPTCPKNARRYPRELKRRLAQADEDEPFDVVVVDHCQTGHQLPPLRRAKVLVAEHNIESEYWRSQLTKRPVRHGLKWLVWRRYERVLWHRADAVTVVSEHDREVVQRVRPDTGVLVPNGITFDRYRFKPPGERTTEPRLLFVGLMTYGPNVLAARDLAQDVLPRVREAHPRALATLAGRNPTPEVRALASPSVDVTGAVDDISTVFDDHAVYVNLVRWGAGSSLKVLEPLATGMPLVASKFAVRGWNLAAGKHYIEVASAAEAAEQVLRVLSEPEKFRDMAERGREVARRYAWSTLGLRFRKVIEDLGVTGRQ